MESYFNNIHNYQNPNIYHNLKYSLILLNILTENKFFVEVI